MSVCIAAKKGKKSSFLFSDTSGGQRHKRGAALSSSTSVGRCTAMGIWSKREGGKGSARSVGGSVGLTPIGRERRLAAWMGRGRRRLLCWQLAITFLASPPKRDGGGASSSSSSAAVWGGGHLIWQSPPPTPLSEGGMEGKKWWEEGG